MKKILSILIIGILFAGSVYAEPRFKEDGTCYKCDGKGKYKNRNYSRKKMGSRKYLKCPDCKGQGKKPRVIDGKMLITKNRRRYKNYSIKSVNEKGITIIYKYGINTKETIIKPKYWPKHLQKDIAEKLYVDSQGKMYGSLSEPRNPKCKVGYAFICNEVPKKDGSMFISDNGKYLILLNAKDHKLKYNYQQKIALLIVGKTGKMNYNAEILSNLSPEQLKAYFSGKTIKKVISEKLTDKN